MAAAAVVGLVNGLASCSPRSRPPDRGRPIAMAEAQRLATVRLRDQRDGHAGFRATVGGPGAAVHLTGWVDWRRPLLYLGSVGDRPGPADGLVQAVPDLVAARPGPVGSADDPYHRPPADPPTRGWRGRPPCPRPPPGAPLPRLFALLLQMCAGPAHGAGAPVAAGAPSPRR